MNMLRLCDSIIFTIIDQWTKAKREQELKQEAENQLFQYKKAQTIEMETEDELLARLLSKDEHWKK